MSARWRSSCWPWPSRAPSPGWPGGILAYYHVSYYPAHPFGPQWTFDAVLVTFIGGAGTLVGPVLGAAFYVFFKEYLAVQ